MNDFSKFKDAYLKIITEASSDRFSNSDYADEELYIVLPKDSKFGGYIFECYIDIWDKEFDKLDIFWYVEKYRFHKEALPRVFEMGDNTAEKIYSNKSEFFNPLYVSYFPNMDSEDSEAMEFEDFCKKIGETDVQKTYKELVDEIDKYEEKILDYLSEEHKDDDPPSEDNDYPEEDLYRDR